MAKQSFKQASSFKPKSQNSRPFTQQDPSGQSPSSSAAHGTSSSTVPVDRSWQNQSLDRSQTAPGGSGSYGVGRWLTEPSWQEPFNTIAEVPAAGSAAGPGGGRQGSGASATHATSRTQHRWTLEAGGKACERA
ncbi:uncharacterized protein ColSpa_00679 [Colletotrichum spaethianum]|uniref:Uncharacterized protein n=1 Tax=Colletotrichum spaethianum TaxID=700344 RepID=A0AA37L212_9PEZI|nr:uncharacterized protein ColSpa_00679 [Colletotrichum spaethianum]GKT40498.1 hypothetical protein ColSpa_00679 [Colletotrichum spaethianum]